jgi:hypothetical protein
LDADSHVLHIGRCGGGVPKDTSEISADYAWSKCHVNVSHSHRRPSRKCQSAARRAGAVKARYNTRNVVARLADQRRLDGAEHRAILSYVMAENRHRKSPRIVHAFTSNPRRIRRPLGRTDTSSRHHGVNDPNAACKAKPGPPPGSFTPWCLCLEVQQSPCGAAESAAPSMHSALSRSSADADWAALQRLRIALPPLAVQRAQSVPVPEVRWVATGSRWHIANLRHSQAWLTDRVDARDAIRLRDLAQVSPGVVDDAEIFAVPANSRVPVLTDIGDATVTVPRGWANVLPDNTSSGFDIAVSPHFPFSSCRVPPGWSVSRRFLVVRANVSTGFHDQPTVDHLIAWFNSIAGRRELAAFASGTVLPRLNVSALSRVPVPESTAAIEQSVEPLALRLERALDVL